MIVTNVLHDTEPYPLILRKARNLKVSEDNILLNISEDKRDQNAVEIFNKI